MTSLCFCCYDVDTYNRQCLFSNKILCQTYSLSPSSISQQLSFFQSKSSAPCSAPKTTYQNILHSTTLLLWIGPKTSKPIFLRLYKFLHICLYFSFHCRYKQCPKQWIFSRAFINVVLVLQFNSENKNKKSHQSFSISSMWHDFGHYIFSDNIQFIHCRAVFIAIIVRPQNQLAGKTTVDHQLTPRTLIVP